MKLPWKELVWHVVRLAFAAGLLAFDIRVFLFYAFTLLLLALHRLDHLRAVMRVFQTVNDGRFILLMKHAGITDAEMRRLGERMYDDLSSDQQASLDRDTRLVS